MSVPSLRCGMIVLVRRKTVVDQQHHAARHRVRQRAHEGAGLQLDFGLVARWQMQRLGCRAQLRTGRPPVPGKRTAAQRNAALLDAGGAAPDQMHRHRVQHFVGDDQTLIQRWAAG